MIQKDKSSLQTALSRHLSISMLVGAVIWIILLLTTVTAARSDTTGIVYDVAFGPLLLQHISKQPAEGGGVVASFSFEAGFMWYILLWILLGVLTALARAKYRPTQTEDTNI